LKNTECTVYITTRRGRAWKYRRDEDGWTETGPNGKVRPMTAEQLLSHILPPLVAGSKNHVSISVIPDPVGRKRRPPTRNTRSRKPR